MDVKKNYKKVAMLQKGISLNAQDNDIGSNASHIFIDFLIAILSLGSSSCRNSPSIHFGIFLQ